MPWGRLLRRRDRGAIAVEVVILTPVFLGLLFGMIEVALLFRDAMAVSALSRTGARVASAEPRVGIGPSFGHAGPAGSGSFAFDAAEAVRTSADTIADDAIQYIRVYEDTGVGPPSSCAGINCVEYSWDDTNNFVYSGGSWNPASIRACLEDPNGTSVGVYVEARHDWVVGFFGGGFGTVTGDTVMKFEPLLADHNLPNTVPGCQP